MRKCLLYLAVAALAACTSAPKQQAKPAETDKQAEFDQGMRALEAEDYSEASVVFERLLLEKPGQSMDLATLYNAGAAYEGLGQCQKAADRYRQVVRASAGKFKRIEGEALFRLSLMYECLGQDTKTITALLDARKRAKDMPPEIVNAEVPARMAAAYARLGNNAKALEYFAQASRGLKGVVAAGGPHPQIELIARTLFLMGQLSPAQRNATSDPFSYLQSIAMQQPYLLQAIEINQAQWSPKAESDLKLAYANIWRFKIDSPDRQREFYTRGLQTINQLRKIRMPSTDPRVESVFAEADRQEIQLQRELSHVAEANPLTPEAQKREGMRQQGRLVDPTPEKNKPSVNK